MDYLLKIDKIINVLIQNNELSASNEIQELKLSASTGSELLMSIVYRLKQLTENDNQINELIGEDVSELLSYCKSIDLNIN